MNLKKAILVVILTALNISLFAQVLEISVDSAMIVASSDELEADAVAIVTNLTNRPVDVAWHRVVNNIPAGWETSVCDNLACYTPSTSTSLFPLTLAAGETTILDVRFYPNNTAGTGHARVVAYATGDSANSVVGTFYKAIFINGPVITGDANANGQIDGNEIAGDANYNKQIDGSEIAGDVNGNKLIDGNEVTGDVNGNNVIDGNEVLGDANGNGTLDPGETTGLQADNQKPNIKIFPDPVKDYFLIKNLPSNQLLTIEVYNIFGRKMMSFVNQYGANASSIPKFNLDELSRGIYMIRVFDQNKNVIFTKSISKG